jgi:hypothetical protein
MEMRSKLRGIFLRHNYPLVKYEFGWLFEPITHWLNEKKVKLYGHFVSSVTAGKLIFLQLHTDPDFSLLCGACQYGTKTLKK